MIVNARATRRASARAERQCRPLGAVEAATTGPRL